MHMMEMANHIKDRTLWQIGNKVKPELNKMFAPKIDPKDLPKLKNEEPDRPPGVYETT